MLSRTLPRLAPRTARLARCALHYGRASTTGLSPARPPAVSSIKLSARPFSSSLSSGALKPFMLADIGEGITECEVVKWHVEVGQTIEEFDPIVEVMSDKATVEITTPFAGRVASLSGAQGDIVKVGSMLCEIEMDGEAGADKPVDPLPPTAPGNPTATTSSEPKASPTPTPTPTPAPEAKSEPTSAQRKEVWATPATRRIARENNVNLNDVSGTGPQGRVSKGDVLAYVSNGGANAAITPSTSALSSAASTSTSVSSSSSTTTIPLSGVRKAMFRAMTASLQIPHFAYSETIDVTALERLRLSLNQHIPLTHRKNLKPVEESQLARLAEWGTGSERLVEEKRYDRMTMLPLLVKALSIAMHEHPLFACTLSGDSALVRRSSHDISIALSAPNGGLFTPLIPSVDSASPYSLASNIAHLQHLSTAFSPPKFPKEYSGAGTITLSNVGVIGGTSLHPIIPPTGQLAIGAMGRMRVEPRYVAQDKAKAKKVATGVEELELGEELRMEPRLLMDVTFSADHRVVEGVELAKLVESWKRLIEEPERIVGHAR